MEAELQKKDIFKGLKNDALPLKASEMKIWCPLLQNFCRFYCRLPMSPLSYSKMLYYLEVLKNAGI